VVEAATFDNPDSEENKPWVAFNDWTVQLLGTSMSQRCHSIQHHTDIIVGLK